MQLPIISRVFGLAEWVSSAVTWIPHALLGLVPKWADPWGKVVEDRPLFAVPLLVALGWLFFVESARLQRLIAERSEWAWAKLKGNAHVAPASRGHTLVRRLRTSSKAERIWRYYDEVLIPNVVGILILLVLWSILVLAVCKAFALLCGIWLDLAVLAALVATCVSFLANAPYRNFIAEKLGPHKIPERRWTYDASDLARFKAAAHAIPLEDGRTVLRIYHSPVLLPNDLIFAVSLGLFIILAGRLLGQSLPNLGLLSALFGFAYAACDATEDMLLARIFGSETAPPKAATWAPRMTRAKMVFLALSVTGLALFAVLNVVGRWRKPAQPRRL